MSTSYVAMLYYGFKIEKEFLDKLLEGMTDNSYEEDVGSSSKIDGYIEKFEDFLARLYGLFKPDKYVSRQKLEQNGDYKKTWDEYYEKCKELKEKVGVELYSYGELESCFLMISDSRISATQFNPTKLGQVINADETWRSKLLEFCAKAKIAFQEPEWHLTSYKC